MKKLIIIGAGGHGRVVADIAAKVGYQEILFLDDRYREGLRECGRYAVAGSCENADTYREYDYVVAIGNTEIRQKLLESLVKRGFSVVSLIHPNAVIAEDVHIGIGTVVMAGAVINTGTSIGDGCIINTASSVDHDCEIDEYVHISVGAHVAGTVTIGKKTWIGAGVTVINNVEICSDCMIGAGAVVVSNVAESGKWLGVPARKMG